MRTRRIIKGLLGVILAFLIAGGVIYFLATRPDESRGTVSIWYVKTDTLAVGLEELCEEYNSTHPRTALPVSLRAFDSEEKLAAECEDKLPDLILCPHSRAFDLGARSRLTDLSAELDRAVDYPMTLSSRNAAIGKSFFPIGCDVQALIINTALCPDADTETGYADIAALSSAALDYTAANGKPFFAADDYSALFYTALLREGEEFTAAVRRGAESENYKTLYNLLAECAYSGALSQTDTPAAEVCAGSLPCAITHTSALWRQDCEELRLYPLPRLGAAAEEQAGAQLDAPQGAQQSAQGRLGVAHGFAVTAGGSRSTGDIAAFLDWLFSDGRDTRLALGSALVPAQAGSIVTRDEMWSALLSLADGSITALPGSDAEFSMNRADFNADFIRRMAFLSE